jgi:hypothetical protein
MPNTTPNGHGLVTPPPDFQGTGALRLKPDWRDFQLARHPGVAAALATFPDAFSLWQYQTGPALNQGATSACVAASSSHMQAMYESMEQGKWLTFDWQTLYAENGGTGNNGVATRDVLQDMQTRGAPVLDSPLRFKIQNYAFVDFSDFAGAIATVKAAVSIKKLVVLALLLPDDFNKGMGAGAASSKVTSSYHQVLIGGYSPTVLEDLNSWGSGYGVNGRGSIEIDFLARAEQRGWLYGFSTLDAPDELPPPPPPILPIIDPDTHYKLNKGRLVAYTENAPFNATFTLDGQPLPMTAAMPFDGTFLSGKRLGLAAGSHVLVCAVGALVSAPFAFAV